MMQSNNGSHKIGSHKIWQKMAELNKITDCYLMEAALFRWYQTSNYSSLKQVAAAPLQEQNTNPFVSKSQ